LRRGTVLLQYLPVLKAVQQSTATCELAERLISKQI
jgi:hypothetical protein